MRNIITIWHGSSHIIEKPEYGRGNPYNDYGLGFYCTEHKALAKEWACTENRDGFANGYQIDVSQLKVLDLSKYSILHWLTLLVLNRRFDTSTPIANRGVQYLAENFLIDTTQYDIIRGYRADDSYFSFARDFTKNIISLRQLEHSMKLGKLGEQIVVTSPKGFSSLQYLKNETSDNTIYYMKRRCRDEAARTAYRSQMDDIEGLFMRDIIKENIQDGDPRLF